MSQMNESSVFTRTAGGSITAFNRVKLDGSQQVVVAGAGEEAIGIAMDDAVSTDRVAVKAFKSGSTTKVVASGAVTIGDTLYGSASGKVSSTACGPKIGIALQAASGNNSVIEMLWLPSAGDLASIGYTVTAGDVTATYKDIDTGLAAKPTVAIVQVSSAAGALRTRTAAWTLGVCRVTPTGITAGDFIEIIYRA